MIDITLQNFETELVEDSMQQPMLLDIWAPWCGPCKSLGPMLEKLETAYDGRFKLAKLNTDEQPEIAGQLSQVFGVRSIPFCVMFNQGQPVDGFVGAMPEGEIREFLDKHVPGAEEQSAAEDHAEAGELLAEGDTDSALDKLQEAVATDPANDAARFDYLRLLIEQPQRSTEARQRLPAGGAARAARSRASPPSATGWTPARAAPRRARTTSWPPRSPPTSAISTPASSWRSRSSPPARSRRRSTSCWRS